MLDDYLLGAAQLRDEAVGKGFSVGEDALGTGHSETRTPVPIRAAKKALQRCQGFVDAAVRRENLRPEQLDLGAVRGCGQHLQRLVAGVFVEQARRENSGDQLLARL